MKYKMAAMIWTVLLCGFMSSIALANEGSKDSSSPQAVGAHAEMGNHGMLVIGGRVETGNIYVSHLPLFGPPHHFQGIWEVTFGKSGDKKYRQAQQAVNRGGKPLHPYFTLQPVDNFLLRDLQKAGASFRADVWARHFERSTQNPSKILSNVEVIIRNRVFFQDLGEELVTVKFAEYIVFGSPQERFLAHRIIHAPTYDQIVQIESPNMPETLSDGMVISGTRLIDNPARVVKVGEEVKGQPSQIITGAPKFHSFNFQVVNEYYLEINELFEDCLSKDCP